MIEFISKSKTDQSEKEMTKCSIDESEANSKLSFKDFCKSYWISKMFPFETKIFPF